MSVKKRSVLMMSIFAIAAVLLSACTQSLSSAPVETPTLIPTGLFVSPIASVENPMLMIEQFAKQTEAAQTVAAGGGTPGTPVATVSGTPGTPQADATTDPAVVASPTSTIAVDASTPTNANPVATTPESPAAAATSVPPGSRPTTYTLQSGEFPYCIARRFNVDPDALLTASGLNSAQANSLAAGTVLTIPQSAGGFPGSRALRAHPATYTVASANETIYSVACLYGDVDPNAIASANGIAVSAKLTLGQTLNIP